MKKTLFQKLTALILALAMTMSMAGTVFAEELAQGDESDGSTVSADVLPVDDTEDDSSETQNTGTAEPGEETDAADTTAPADETDPADGSTSGDGSSSAPATDPADGTDPADASSSADGSASASSEEVLDPESTTVHTGWNVVTTTTGTTTTTAYQFCYSFDESGVPAYLEEGYYYIKEDIVYDGVTYQSGIYYFDENGYLAEEEGITKLDTTLSDKKTAAVVLKSENHAGGDSGNSIYYTCYQGVRWDEDNSCYEVYGSGKRIFAIVDASAEDGGVTDPTVAAPYANHTGRVTSDQNLWCVNGSLYKGFWRCMANTTANNDAGYDTRLYYVKSGKAALYKGKMDAASAKLLGITAQYAVNGEVQTTLDGKVYNKGVVFTGLFTSACAGNPDYGYYTSGVIKSSLNGWWYYNNKTGKWSTSPFKTSVNKKKQVYGVINQIYYFVNGYAYHGVTKYLKSIGGGASYYYTFKDNAQLVTNMFSYNSAYKSKKLRIVCSRKNHTCTIFAYNSKTKKYDIPCKSFVGAFAKLSSRFHPGTYKVKKKNMWFNDSQATKETNPKKWNWYKYSAHIWGSGALFHTSNYKYKGNSNSMRAHLYNQLGTNVTSACIRVQCVNAKLIYSLCKTSKSLTAQLGYSDSNDAFGTMSLEYNFDQTGGVKVPSNDLTKDPTDK